MTDYNLEQQRSKLFWQLKTDEISVHLQVQDPVHFQGLSFQKTHTALVSMFLGSYLQTAV